MVTENKFYMEKLLKAKLDKMILRCTQDKPKLDASIVCSGDEGTGKSTLIIGAAHYVSTQTGRTFNADNVFFSIKDLFEYAKKTEDQILVWDEAALGGLAAEHFNKDQVFLIKLLMTARKKRHFLFINIPKFWKLSEYIVVDRALGLIQTYSKNEEENGYYIYFNKKAKEKLYYCIKTKKQRRYKQYKTFWGKFPDVLDKDYKGNILNKFSVAEYEKKKDEAIASIGDKDKDEHMSRYKKAYIRHAFGYATLAKYLKENYNFSYSDAEKLSGLNHSVIKEALKFQKKHEDAFL